MFIESEDDQELRSLALKVKQLMPQRFKLSTEILLAAMMDPQQAVNNTVLANEIGEEKVSFLTKHLERLLSSLQLNQSSSAPDSVPSSSSSSHDLPSTSAPSVSFFVDKLRNIKN